ncbi:MAG TPA: lectin like domain-containing protein, partial [Methanolinea sp.]|nr:lectin like domain-containing protein [Methanolinea sp.]
MGTPLNRYYDPNSAFNSSPLDTYDYIYQYDHLGWTNADGYNTDTAWYANIFTATRNEELSAVGTYVYSPGSQYELTIFKFPSANDPWGTPVSHKTGTIDIPGYRTIPLDNAVLLWPGYRFSVVLKLTTPNWTYPVPLEMPIPGYSSKATASRGQSYMSKDGVIWTDVVDRYSNTNVCLKAYTRRIAPPVAGFTATPEEGPAPLVVQFTDTSTGNPTVWSWDFGDGMKSAERNPR